MTRGNFGDATSLGEHALRLSRRRKLSTATLLQQLALRPELVSGVELGELLTPEALRHPGQWVVRSEDLLSFHLELTNLHVASGVEGGPPPPIGTRIAYPSRLVFKRVLCVGVCASWTCAGGAAPYFASEYTQRLGRSV